MVDIILRPLRKGEKKPLFGKGVADSGTLTISTQPKITIYDSAGAAVAGLSNLDTTGYDAGAAATVKAWYNLDSTTPTALAAGFYTAVITFSALGSSDNMTRTYKSSLGFWVVEAYQ